MDSGLGAYFFSFSTGNSDIYLVFIALPFLFPYWLCLSFIFPCAESATLDQLNAFTRLEKGATQRCGFWWLSDLCLRHVGWMLFCI